MRFVALDVETANPDLSSICQIGLVVFENGSPFETWSVLVDPEDWFDDVNVSIHGIDERKVRGSPNYKTLASELHRRLQGQIVASHTTFDRSAVARASARHGTPVPSCSWLDTARVARRAWPDVAMRGYGLAPLAERFGIRFSHHDAAEDARAAGLILVRAMADTGLDIAGWMERVRRPLNPFAESSMHRDGNPEGALFGEVVVFTGTLAVPRREAAEMAARMGCEVDDGVTKHTTLLVVGDQDIRVLHGHEKSSKHRKAEELIAKGKPIRILGESDFMSLLSATLSFP
ncbi:exonuclease domain-containing protein [Ralstonia solanacearum]|uniref:exonuclease domain-containing protein n=1 Tax=Ralstonia solanacearum TaxID=305 RepID=UPI003515F5A9